MEIGRPSQTFSPGVVLDKSDALNIHLGTRARTGIETSRVICKAKRNPTPQILTTQGFIFGHIQNFFDD